MRATAHEADDQAASDRIAGLHVDLPLVLVLMFVLALFTALHFHLDRQYDFGTFYYAAHMVMDGARHSLYDAAAQHAFQAQYHRPPDMLFRNPPYALLPLLPLTKLPIVAAFVLWTAGSLVLLYVSLKILEIECGVRYGNWPILLSFCFAPVLGNFLHGQFSMATLACFAATHSLWRRGRAFGGGLLLSVATIKYQLLFGVVAVLLLKRKVKELSGFALGCVVLLGLADWMVGFRSLLAYPNFALHADLPISELSHLGNWRGCLSLVALNHLWILLPLSVATVIWAARMWTEFDRGFAAATLAAMLVSYHLAPQDLSLMLVPFYLFAKTGLLPPNRVPVVALIAVAGMFAMVNLSIPLALMALPIAGALLWMARRKPTTEAESILS